MDLTLRSIEPDEYDAFHAAMTLGFGGSPHADERELERTVLELDRTIAAFDGGRIVATGGAFSLTMTAPGGELPVAGVTWVAVTPTHRRRGVLTRMMTEQLADVRARGREAVAALFASESAIYPRFGYGLACFGGAIRMDTARGAFVPRPRPPGEVVLLDPRDAQAVVAPAYDAARRSRPGMLARTDEWWGKRLSDIDSWRGDGSPLRVAAYLHDGRCLGYASYRTRSEWQDGIPNGTVEVRELVAADPDAEAALWRFVLDLDLMRTLTAQNLPADVALLHLLADPRAARMRMVDNLWVRLVDVARALSERAYAVPASVVLEVADEVCPWNAGRFRLEGGPDGARCAPTGDAPELRLSATELGAAYLGGTRLASLAAAGRVTELAPGALARADAMFGWAPAPVCPEIF